MTIRIGTAEAGGTFHSQGAALARVLDAAGVGSGVEVLATANASVGNAERLEAGEIEFGFMAANWIGRAKDGTPPFARPLALRMAAPANTGPLFFVVLAASELRRIPDLVGKRVAVGIRDSGMVQHVHTIFDALGIPFAAIDPAYVGFEEGADALAAGALDAQFQCPIPNAVMTALSQRADLRVLSHDEGRIERLLAAVPFYRRAVMRAGAFRGLASDIDQIGVLNVVVTHARVADDIVAATVAAMIAGAAELARLNVLFDGLEELFRPLQSEGAEALEPGGVKLHPGALVAYRAAGLLD